MPIDIVKQPDSEAPLPLVDPRRAGSRGGPGAFAVRRLQSARRDTAMHRHARGQLLGVERGLLTMYAGQRQWVSSPAEAVWIPPDCPHGMRSHGPFEGYSVYLSPAACAGLPEAPCALAASSLLLAAVHRAASWDAPVLDARQRRVVEVIRDEIRGAAHTEGGLALPRDPRLQRVALEIFSHPADTRSLAEWAARAAMAPRTLARRFQAETGMTLGAWRQRARLMQARERLAAGHSVTAVALDLGYDNISAFIAMFRRETGLTPGRYASLAVRG